MHQRLVSLDAFRGATIASMILVNHPGGPDTYAPLRHADWHGWTVTDLIFPFFLWIVGVSMVFSFARRLERGDGKLRCLRHTCRRALLLFLLGLALNGFPFYRLDTLRIPGVLQRIALCYLVAGLIYLFFSLRGQLLAIVGLLAGYWMLMTLVPVPGFGPGVLEKQGNLAQYVDSLVLAGHLYAPTGTWDPEGIVSTLPAIANTLFGILCGSLLRSRHAPSLKVLWMTATGLVLAALGLVMDVWLPINKNLWTSSYAVFTSGLAFVGLAAFYSMIDVRGWKAASLPWVIFGMNAIAAYVLSGVVARLLSLTGARTWLMAHVFSAWAAPRNASLLYALMNVTLVFAAVWVLYRRRWFWKL